jgi:hypothetical protein
MNFAQPFRQLDDRRFAQEFSKSARLNLRIKSTRDRPTWPLGPLAGDDEPFHGGHHGL